MSLNKREFIAIVSGVTTWWISSLILSWAIGIFRPIYLDNPFGPDFAPYDRIDYYFPQVIWTLSTLSAGFIAASISNGRGSLIGALTAALYTLLSAVIGLSELLSSGHGIYGIHIFLTLWLLLIASLVGAVGGMAGGAFRPTWGRKTPVIQEPTRLSFARAIGALVIGIAAVLVIREISGFIESFLRSSRHWISDTKGYEDWTNDGLRTAFDMAQYVLAGLITGIIARKHGFLIGIFIAPTSVLITAIESQLTSPYELAPVSGVIELNILLAVGWSMVTAISSAAGQNLDTPKFGFSNRLQEVTR